MLLVEKKRLILILALSFFTIIASGVWGYIVVLQCNQKSNAESILFYAFIIAGMQLTVTTYLLLHARQKEKELMKLTNILRYGGNLSDSHFQKFGLLGKQIQIILKELLNLSVQKSLRIAALNGVEKTLMELLETPILLIDLTGSIIDLTKKAKAELNYSGEVNIEDLISSTDIKRVVQEAEKTHGVVEHTENISFIPVFSTIGNIAYFLVDISKKGSFDWSSILNQKNKAEQGKSQPEKKKKPFRFLFE